MNLSKSPGHGRRRLSTAMALTALMLAGVALPGGPVFAEAGSEKQKTYIVQMAQDPVVTYEGDTAGLPTTKPRRGEKIDSRSAEVTKYVAHLRGEHDAVLKKVGGGKKLYEYVYSFEGFAAKLTKTQAAKLRAMPDVVAVTEDKKVSVQTASIPSFLGLDARGGLWDKAGGATGKDGAGEGLVIGVVDTGIWPGSKSFAGTDGKGKPFPPIRDFHGACGPAGDDSWDGTLCNGKLISARHFNAAWGGDAGIKENMPWEFLSPRDYHGHGTHTASTAGGDYEVATTGPAAAFEKTVSGIAPRGRIAAYKALWSAEDASTANGFPSDLVAAIDQAVADGVDVINYSVSGTNGDFLDPVEVAFLSAAEAGVFVSAAGGNDGPAASTVAHPSPWITTVAAGTHNRGTQGSVTLGNGTTYSGASLAPAKAGPAPLIDATAAGLPGADPERVALCYTAKNNGGDPVLDPEKVKGKIVICDRGVTPRLDKSIAVAEAGGIGTVLTNVDENSLNAELHQVPTVHLAAKDRQAVKDYAATSDATATIEQAKITNVPAPHVAAFSSRGPLLAAGGDLLKPDVTAPGQDILAAVAPPGNHGLGFNFYSGTSMAAPHVAGLAALLKDLHPDWSPMAIKSALMTTGSNVLDGPATDPKVIFAKGAGHVIPNSAADPGLVYDSDIRDWTAFLCATTKGVQAETCEGLSKAGYSLDPSDMNAPSISVGRLSGGTATVTRKVTNVGRSTATYTASTAGLAGITTTVSPRRLTLKPGEVKSFTVTFTRTTAPMNVFQGGQLTWKERHHTVTVPVVVRPVQETWAAIHGAAKESDSGDLITLDPKGERLYASGNSISDAPGRLQSRITTAAYDPATGVEVWSNRYAGPGGYDEVKAMKVSPDGSKIYLTGIGAGKDTNNDVVTIAYDAATGKELWVARHDTAKDSDLGKALAVGPDGKTVYVTGLITQQAEGGDNGNNDFVTIAYNADNGTPKWTSSFDGPGGDTDDARVVEVSPDGSKVFVTGQSSGPAGTGLCDWGTVAYDAGTGERLWSVHHDGPANGIDVPSGMVVAADGKAVFVTGTTETSETQSDVETVAFDTANGKELWADRYDGPGHKSDTPHDVTLARDGSRLYVTGNTVGEGTNSDYTTIAYDTATGKRSWMQRYNGQAGDDDLAWDVAVSPDGGNVIVTGESADDAAKGEDYVTIAYDAASGEQKWMGRFDGQAGAQDAAHALAVDAADGAGVRIFVTGTSVTGGTPPVSAEVDFATVAYIDPWKQS